MVDKRGMTSRGFAIASTAICTALAMYGVGHFGHQKPIDHVDGDALQARRGQVRSEVEPDPRVIAVCLPSPMTQTIDADHFPNQDQKQLSAESLEAEVKSLRLKGDKCLVILALVRQGDRAVAEIERQLSDRRSAFGLCHDSVLVCEKLNSERSRAVLRRIATGQLGNGNPNNEGWAAGALIRCDKQEAEGLLVATPKEVLVPALIALKGQPINEKRMALLQRCLASDDPFVSWQAAEVMSLGSAGELADAAVVAIVNAISVAAARPDADSRFPNGVGDTTNVEWNCSVYTSALRVARVENRRLRELGKRLTGRAHDAMLVALGSRSDKSVHDDLIKLAEEPNAGLFRVFAVRALEEIGSPADLAVLRRLEKEDPLVRDGPLRRPPVDQGSKPFGLGSRGPMFPVREAAEHAIRKIEEKKSLNDEQHARYSADFDR